MSEIKVNLSLTLPGRVMMSPQRCGENPENYDHFTIKVKKSLNSKRTSTVHVATRKSKAAKQNIKLSKEAFESMTSSANCPIPGLQKVWDNLTRNQRLQYHCEQIAKALGAIGFTFEVLND